MVFRLPESFEVFSRRFNIRMAAPRHLNMASSPPLERGTASREVLDLFARNNKKDLRIVRLANEILDQDLVAGPNILDDRVTDCLRSLNN